MSRLFTSVLGYIVLLQMFTLPIGNLLFISSSNTLTMIFAIGILILQNFNIKLSNQNKSLYLGARYDIN